MLEGITIIKLGGSIITDKTVPFKILYDNIADIAEQIAKYGRRNLLLVHGGGSVGHYLVEKLKFNEKEAQDPKAISTIIYEMDNLTQTISKTFLEFDVPVVALQTHSIAFLGERGIVLDSKFILNWLRKGLIPILKGDIILGYDSLARVISGDVIVSELAKLNEVRKVIMCFDQDGIIGKDGSIIKQLSLKSNFEELIWLTGKYDVTGGLRAKLNAMAPIVSLKKEVYFMNPKRNRLLNALMEKEFKGTKLVE
jgi:isopentenyl phosphate kinase